MTLKPIRICITIALILVAGVSGKEVRCDACGNPIRGQYISSNLGTLCSKSCLLKKLPKCTTCTKPLEGPYMVNEGRNYCSEKCMTHLLPPCRLCGTRTKEFFRINDIPFCPTHASGPRCDTCVMPFDRGVSLSDGRKICSVCDGTAITNREAAFPIFKRARKELESLTGQKMEHVPPMVLVDRQRLATIAGNTMPGVSRTSLRGFYHRVENETITKNLFGKVTSREISIDKTVYLLLYMDPESFQATAIHELTHDMIAEFYPQLAPAPDWVEEGICQYTAATVCRRNKLGTALTGIEESKCPIYGAGYRWFKNKFGDDNWKGVEVWIKTADMSVLPNTPPQG